MKFLIARNPDHPASEQLQTWKQVFKCSNIEATLNLKDLPLTFDIEPQDAELLQKIGGFKLSAVSVHSGEYEPINSPEVPLANEHPGASESGASQTRHAVNVRLNVASRFLAQRFVSTDYGSQDEHRGRLIARALDWADELIAKEKETRDAK